MTIIGERSTIRAAAEFHGISPETLWGVYGTESSYGKNLGPSSAGAIGPFQFLPSTAKMLKIKDPMDLQDAAFGASKYLKMLGANGKPDSPQTAAALNRYSGGGGEAYRAKVLANGKTFSKSPADDIVNAVTGVTDPITKPFQAAQDAGEAIGSGIKWLTDPSSWLRVGKGALGFTLINIGVLAAVLIVAKPVAKSVIGVSGTGKVVKRAAKSVSEVAS